MRQRGRFLLAVLGMAALLAGTGVGAGAEDVGGFTARPIAPVDVYGGVKSPAGMVSVLVKFDAEPVAKYRGGVPGLPATSPQVTRSRIRRSDASVQAYESFLAGKEARFGEGLRRRVPRARIVHRLRMIFGGVSVIVPREQVAELARLPEVKAIYPDVLLPLNTDRSTEFIGAPDLWAQVGGKGQAGEGIVVGILDSGIWPESPSVQDDGSFPPPPATWTGTACEFGSATPGDLPFACDNKLIGARRVMATFDAFGPPPLPGEYFTARDNNSHGSHTATTAAGNSDVDAEFQGASLGIITGVAPRAHIAAYKVCFTDSIGQGSCFSSDSAAAVQQAIIDGVDVINFSIGGGQSPYSDPVSLAFLDAYAAGVFVACSAGNSGPGADTVGHREPWTTTVAATTTDKLYGGSASLSATSGASLDVTGVSAFDGMLPPAPVVLSSAPPYSNVLCDTPAPAGTFDGMIVACQRGAIARVAKSANVAAGGAVGMIHYNADPGQSLNADVHSVPTVHIDSDQGLAVVDFLTNEADPFGSITGMRSLDGQGDVLAVFSSRGGPGQTLGISKPDVGAPGVDILAGVSGMQAVPVGPDGQLWDIFSGTSMASPHVAGAAALLKQLHPGWGPGDIKSALMMTATTAVVNEDGVTSSTPFDVGSGRIDLARAGDAGLLISDTAENFFALQGNLSVANYPSLYLPVMPGKVDVSRTVVNALEGRHRCNYWKVSVEAPPDVKIHVPRRLFFWWRDAREIWISIDASRVPLGETRHARLVFKHRRGHGGHYWFWKRHRKATYDTLTFPVTLVKQQGGTTLVKMCDETDLTIGDVTHCTIAATNTTFEPANVVVSDRLPRQLRLGSVEGATRVSRRSFVFQGALAPADPPSVMIGPGASPAGYLPLSLFGIAPIGGVGDETIVNFSGITFVYAGQLYDRIGMVTNGYAVVGGGTSADVDFINQNLPDPNAPNNVLAPYWTDLDLSKGGEMRAGILGDGVNSWLVLDWESARFWTASDTQENSFQMWILLGGPAGDPEGIHFTYGEVGVGDGGFLTVGAENLFGNRGENDYFDGVGTLPAAGNDLLVSGAPGAPGETHEINFSVRARRRGSWRNCAEMGSDAVFGTTTACVSGKVSGRRH